MTNKRILRTTMKDRYTKDIVYEIKRMDNGNVKSLRENDLTFIMRYKLHKITHLDVYYDWLAMSIMSIDIKYIRSYARVEVFINDNINKLSIVDIETGEIYDLKKDINNYIMKALHIDCEKVYMNIKYTYSQDNKESKYLYSKEYKTINGESVLKIICEDLDCNDMREIQIYRDDSLSEEYIGGDKYYYEYSGKLLCKITRINNILGLGKREETKTFTYNEFNQLISEIDFNKFETKYTYNDYGLIGSVQGYYDLNYTYNKISENEVRYNCTKTINKMSCTYECVTKYNKRG